MQTTDRIDEGIAKDSLEVIQEGLAFDDRRVVLESAFRYSRALRDDFSRDVMLAMSGDVARAFVAQLQQPKHDVVSKTAFAQALRVLAEAGSQASTVASALASSGGFVPYLVSELSQAVTFDRVHLLLFLYVMRLGFASL